MTAEHIEAIEGRALDVLPNDTIYLPVTVEEVKRGHDGQVRLYVRLRGAFTEATWIAMDPGTLVAIKAREPHGPASQE